MTKGIAVALAVGVEATVAVAVAVSVFPALDPSEQAETSSAKSAPCTMRNAALQCILFAVLGCRSTLISFHRVLM